MSAASPSSLRDRFVAVRAASCELASRLGPEDLVVQSMPDASPGKWHLAHTTWFFEAFLLSRVEPGFSPHDARFEYLFNSYYDAVGARHPRSRRGMLTRPTLDEVLGYRLAVDERVEAALARGLDDAAAEVLVLGLHHEQQHQELFLTDALHLLSESPLAPALAPRSAPSSAPARGPARAASFLEHPGGLVQVGFEPPVGADALARFSFDNEGPRHRVWLEPFELCDRLVTAGEYEAFLDDGGYQRPELWLAEGLAFVREHGLTGPLYWRPREGGARLRFSPHGLVPVEPCEPVCHVSYYEADAFARWAGARLPTEHEWEVVAAREPVTGTFVESGELSPRPAAPGERQLFGEVWQWTQSAYAAYPGFEAAAGALGEYNGKFMVSQQVLRGGSCFSPASHLRATYRNFFPPSARWQMTGIRLARSLGRRGAHARRADLHG